MRLGVSLVGAGLALLGMGIAMPAARASSYRVIYTAPPSQTFRPAVGAVSNGLIYGTDPTNGSGVLFTLTTRGKSFRTLHVFDGSDGSSPNARLAVIKGTIYGTTHGGGSTGAGTVFAMAPRGSLLWSHAFASATEGNGPLDGLAVGADGLFYGTTSGGALAPGNGALFRVGLHGHVTVLYQFRSQADGHCPFTGVVLDAAGDIYGTTVGMGFGGQPNGAVWKMPAGDVPATTYAFENGSDGEFPRVTPTLDGAGRLWGVTPTTLAPAAGAVWMLTGPTLQFVHDFTGGADGDAPNGPLLLGHDGNLYGTTSGGGNARGNDGLGTLFRITTTGTPQLTTLHSFAGGADGAVPTGSLAIGPAGHIFGGTQAGTIFAYTP